MRKSIFYIGIIAIVLSGCSSDEPSLPEEQPTTSENIHFDFNHWIYSQMNRQYLWRKDMPDSINCNYDLAPKDFFQSLLSEKDRFSYFTNNPSYNGKSEDYGFAYQKVRDANNNEALQVLYVESSDAKCAGLHRGDYVRVISKESMRTRLKRLSITNGILTDSGESIEFTLEDPTSPKNSVLLDSIYYIDDKRIGYLCYLEYAGVGDLYDPIQKFANNQISELILDLRYNPGGYVNTCQYLSNCIVSPVGFGKLFQQCSYNDVLSAEYKNTTGEERTYSYFDFPSSFDKDILGVRIINLNLKKLYVLTSSHTASASEATIVCLNPYMDVITIGEQTVGKGVGSWNISSPKYPYSIQPITMRYYNANSETTPDEGIIPDYEVPDGYVTNKKEIGQLDEPLLATAISLINGLDITIRQYVKADMNVRINSLKPIGDPSYVTTFRERHRNGNDGIY